MLAIKSTHCTCHSPSVGEHSPMLAFMLSSLPNGGTWKWETGKHAHSGEKSLFLKLNIAPCMHMYIFCCLKEILKRPLAFGGGEEGCKVRGSLCCTVMSPLYCTSSCQSLLQRLANTDWQITKNMNQVSKTNHSVVILHDLHGINLWTVGES